MLDSCYHHGWFGSAGKSLVAEVLMLRRILSTGKKAFLVLPYVALCSEKVRLLVSILLL
jgi:DNA polymerase theta